MSLYEVNGVVGIDKLWHGTGQEIEGLRILCGRFS